jgi:single-strand DNA-binding protein
MSGSVNKVIIVGNLGRDPEVRDLNNGGKVMNLSVATSERWRDKASGDKRELTEWHRVTTYDERLIDVAQRFTRKGSKVYLEGKLQTRKYEKDGQDHYTTEIILDRFKGVLTLLDGKSDGDDERHYGGSKTTADDYRRARDGGGSSAADLDDEIPF